MFGLRQQIKHLCYIYPGKSNAVCYIYPGKSNIVCYIYPGKSNIVCYIYPGKSNAVCYIYPGKSNIDGSQALESGLPEACSTPREVIDEAG